MVAAGPRSTGRPTTPVKSADRILTILELLSADPRPRTYSELLAETGLPKSSLHGLLATLAARSWLTETRPGPTYTLGIRALEAGGAYMRESGAASIQSILDNLALAVGETVNLGTLEGRDVVYLAVRRSRQALAMRSAVGLRLPAHASAMGKALLAEWADDDIRAQLTEPLTRLARNTCTDVDTLLREVEQTRTRGYALELEEATDGIGCVAVTVPTTSADRLAISASFPLTRHSREMEQQLVQALEQGRGQLAAALAVDPTAEIA